jgi:hypothetical protein
MILLNKPQFRNFVTSLFMYAMENKTYTYTYPSCWPTNTLYPQKLVG